MEPTVRLVLVMVLLVVYTASALRIVKEHEQGLVSRFGAHHAVLGPGLHLLVPLIDRLRRVDLRQLAVIEPIERGAVGRIRIGEEAWDARSEEQARIGPDTRIRIVRVEGPVMVVAAAP
jgi:regulator of protease activity HflC (stomatin/prohibitin superfamily)